jgi:hypothetical protein
VIDSSSTVTMNDSSSVTGNTADFVDQGGVTGGGIYIWPCGGGALIGGVDGGNVNDNYRGTAAPVEDNISARLADKARRITAKGRSWDRPFCCPLACATWTTASATSCLRSRQRRGTSCVS